MTRLQDFREILATAQAVTSLHPNTSPDVTPLNVSNRVVELAIQINSWHETRAIPNKWYPVQLGRVAAYFDVSRELAAASLAYGGWEEHRAGAVSLWRQKPKT